MHRVPELPVRIDGVLYDPKDIGRFDGQPLHFVAVPKKSGHELIGSTGDVWIESSSNYFRVRDMLSITDINPLAWTAPRLGRSYRSQSRHDSFLF